MRTISPNMNRDWYFGVITKPIQRTLNISMLHFEAESSFFPEKKETSVSTMSFEGAKVP